MISYLYPLLRRLVKTLDREGDPYALVGGLAVGVRTEPRFTKDIDFAIAVPDDSAAERAVYQLQQEGLSTSMILERKGTGQLATVRLRSLDPDDAGMGDPEQPRVDLLFATSGIETEAVSEAVRIRIPGGIRLPVAQVPHLIAMKLLSVSERRTQDKTDLNFLIAVAKDRDLLRVRELITLIHDRGFAADRDLHARFDALLTEHERTAA